MNTTSERKHLSAISVFGLSITTNETNAMQDIGALWQRGLNSPSDTPESELRTELWAPMA